MTASIKYGRRLGNTTRQVDQWIQELFTDGSCTVIDHAHRPDNMANKHAERILFSRLHNEHGLTFKEPTPLQFDKETRTLTLLPF